MNVDIVFGICIGSIVTGGFLLVLPPGPPDKRYSIDAQIECRESLIREGKGLYCPKTGEFALMGDC